MAEVFWGVVCRCGVRVVGVDVGSLHFVHDVQGWVEFAVDLFRALVWFS